MKRLILLLIVLLTTLCSYPTLAADNPCSGTGNSQPCKSAPQPTSSAPAAPAALMVSIQDQVAAASLASEAAAMAAQEPRKSVLRDNIYFNAIFWILALLAPLGAGIMIVLNLLEYRFKRQDKVED
ncbi:hypothetical protein [Undibacterium sp. RuTC16W]|uniref:hypothetical protein n=1 Tax=Undibacterium sp. RuTC16W TaxID=3413048 RepID=UPI003BF20233